MEYKTQLFELTRDKNYSIARSRELLRFIFLLISLPEKEHLKFDKTVRNLMNMENIQEIMTPKEAADYKRFANVVAEGVYGESIESMLKKKDAVIGEKDAVIGEKDAALVEKDIKFTRKLLLKGDFSVKEIAELVGISEYKVRKIRKEMEEN